MQELKILFDGKVQLEKYPGKGGWTFAALPGIQVNKSNPFGWRKVNGFIDEFEIKEYNLMPMGNEQLFLPVKAEIRKQIQKEAGDWVHIKLAAATPVLPEVKKDDFILCLKDDEQAWENFQKFAPAEQQAYFEWVWKAKGDEERVEKIAEAINRIARNEKI